MSRETQTVCPLIIQKPIIQSGKNSINISPKLILIQRITVCTKQLTFPYCPLLTINCKDISTKKYAITTPGPTNWNLFQ